MSNGVDVGPGQKANIAITQNNYEFMHQPWGLCDYDTRNQRIYENYTLPECLEECYVEKVNETCACKPHYARGMTRFREIEECTLRHVVDDACFRGISIIKGQIDTNHCDC